MPLITALNRRPELQAVPAFTVMGGERKRNLEPQSRKQHQAPTTLRNAEICNLESILPNYVPKTLKLLNELVEKLSSLLG